jgi:hypothetical protein
LANSGKLCEISRVRQSYTGPFMQKPNSSTGLLIVLELGAEWPSALLAELSAARPLGARRVFAQQESEPPAAFAARLSEQLDGLFARGTSLGATVVACSERLDQAARGARAELGRTVASVMARGAGGPLLLTACDRNEGRSRATLLALESELIAEWRSAAIETKLRFAGDAASPVTSSVVPAKAEAKTRRARGAGKDGARRVA